jgi:hypothetical protein
VYIQISCAIWRLANCHIGYGLINLGWGVSYGSYTNITRRFITAVKDTYKNVIKWPVDEEKVREIQQGFQHPNGDIGPHRLPRVIGKNIIIHPPSPLQHREFWRDRKGHFSVKLTAICDHKCRFTYISVGDSGICYYPSHFESAMFYVLTSIQLGRTHDAAAFEWTEVSSIYLRDPDRWFPLNGYIIAGKTIRCP